MFIVNPPWTLRDTLQPCLPWLARVLAQDAGAGFTLQSRSAGSAAGTASARTR